MRRMEHKEDTEEQLGRKTQQQKYAIGVKGRVGPMIDMCPSDPRRIASYFHLIEGVFDKFQVEDSLKVKILLSKLDVKMRNVMNELDNDKRYDYEVVKRQILQRCRFSPMKLRDEFFGSRKAKDETFPAFAARLHSCLRLYFQSRQAESFDRGLSLLVADRMKELLPKNLLDHILTRESEDWFTHDQMADILERYEANMNMTCSTAHAAGYKVRPMTNQDNLNTRWQKTETKSGPVSVSGCYSRGNTGHLAKHCSRKIKDEPVKRIMKCQVNQMLDGTVNEQAQEGVGKKVQVGKFFKRPFVKVQVQGKQFCDALVDSGVEVCCISEKFFDALNLERMGQLRIVGLDGQIIAPSVKVWCAIIPNAHKKLLITPDVVERLKGTEEYAVPLVSLEEDTRNASGKVIQRRIKTFDGLTQEGKGQMFYDPEVGLTQWEPWNQEANNNNNIDHIESG
ncbi:hypothetical protein HELRODRAFT_172661 [Helobdella robusta]|uniref:CCHC-type domain-containing protein n=1 Tax=Helobdella robusta TaxID=6412 RepID=T1F5R2_HELRO|nr:hypothetical protein HELRODRAFT_172661 [Helobdella robusta]ESO04305.1 hypothetical protein HELRODRAFT_172661 [Helobdella robusta]